MKKIITAILFSLFICHAAYAETITIVADVWCPYNCEANSNKKGLMIEIAQRAFARNNIQVEYKTMPWTQAIKETREGKYNAIVGASHDDAPDFIFPSIQQAEMRNTFYVKKGSNWRYTGLDSLKDITLGIVADYSYSKNVNSYLQSNKNDKRRVQAASGYNALADNIKKLTSGEITAIIDAQSVMEYQIQQKKLDNNIVEAGMVAPSEQDKLFIAFSPANKNSKKYVDILEKEERIMRDNGELKAILARYNLSDWQK